MTPAGLSQAPDAAAGRVAAFAYRADAPGLRRVGGEVLWLLGLVLLTFALRAPFARISCDEAFFTVVGRDWAQGALPYAARFDVKPPGLFLLYALSDVLFGPLAVATKGIESVFVGLGAYGLWRIGRAFLSKPAGAAAALLYPVCTLAMEGVDAPVALFQNAFEIFAVLAALAVAREHAPQPAWRFAALAGLLFGSAAMIKQSAALEAGAVFLVLVFQAQDGRERLRRAAAFVVAGAVAPLGFAAYFLAEGQFGAFWSAAVAAAAGRLGGDNVGFFEGLSHLPAGLRPMLPFAVAALLVALRLRRISGRLRWPLQMCLAWLAGGLIAIIAQRAMYPHYFLPLAPPLLLLGAASALHILDFGGPRRALAARAALVAVAALCVPLYGFDEALHGGDDAKALAGAVEAARAAGLRPGDSALVVNRGVMFYAETGAAVASRVFHPQHLLCDFPQLQGDQLAEAMATHPRFVLRANPAFGMVCQKAARMAALDAVLSRDYQPIASIPGISTASTFFGGGTSTRRGVSRRVAPRSRPP